MILHAMDATNAISHATHATNVISHAILHHIVTAPVLYVYNLSSKRVFALCIQRHHPVDSVAMAPRSGRGNGDHGVDAATLGREAVKGVSRKSMCQYDVTNAISHLSHATDATNAISHSTHAINAISHTTNAINNLHVKFISYDCLGFFPAGLKIRPDVFLHDINLGTDFSSALFFSFSFVFKNEIRSSTHL